MSIYIAKCGVEWIQVYQLGDNSLLRVAHCTEKVCCVLQSN
jgi:hypothetical protein